MGSFDPEIYRLWTTWTCAPDTRAHLSRVNCAIFFLCHKAFLFLYPFYFCTFSVFQLYVFFYCVFVTWWSPNQVLHYNHVIFYTNCMWSDFLRGSFFFFFNLASDVCVFVLHKTSNSLVCVCVIIIIWNAYLKMYILYFVSTDIISYFVIWCVKHVNKL